MMSILDELNIEPDKLEWRDLAACKSWPFKRPDGNIYDPFFEAYENDPYYVGPATDALCNTCPVQRFCFESGVSSKSTGVWGGVYLVDGEPDKRYNAHKTDDVWNTVRERVGCQDIP